MARSAFEEWAAEWAKANGYSAIEMSGDLARARVAWNAAIEAAIEEIRGAWISPYSVSQAQKILRELKEEPDG